MGNAAVKIPGFYEPIPVQSLREEIEGEFTKPNDHNEDSLPFGALHGRRFEIWAFLIKQSELKNTNAVVTLVKASRDGGRDVLVHLNGELQCVIQCKNLQSKLSCQGRSKRRPLWRSKREPVER